VTSAGDHAEVVLEGRITARTAAPIWQAASNPEDDKLRGKKYRNETPSNPYVGGVNNVGRMRRGFHRIGIAEYRRV
jgi:hypothetical protein